MKRIVILGSGFAGTYVTRYLDRAFRHDSDVEIMLLSRNNYMVFTPLLAEVAGNVVEERHAVPPLRIFLKKARFRQAEVLSVDIAGRTVEVQYPEERTAFVPFDYLVIALGSATKYNAPGADINSFDLKSLEDAIRLRNHVLLMLEEADHTEDPALRQEMLTFVAAGGGYAGLEGIGQLIDFVTKALRFYPSLKREDLRFVLASRGKHLLENIDDQLGKYIVEKLSARGVDVRLGVKVTAVTDHDAVLEPGGSVPTRTVLWATGIAVSPIVAEIDLPKTEHGAIKVLSTLQVEGHDQIFALGDCAAVPNGNGTYAPTAQNATREARTAADNIVALIRGGIQKPFHFVPMGSLASIGHYQAVARVFNFSFSGFPAWLAWRAIYLGKLPTFSRKLRVLLDWMLEFVLHADIVQLPVLPSDDMRFMQMRDAHSKLIEQTSTHANGKAEKARAAQQVSDAASNAPPPPTLDAAKQQNG